MRGDSKSLPKKVKLVDLFSGVVKLNDKGEADIPLDLPDFNGTLRLMAVAFTADNFGSTDAEMVVAAPIVAELNTPRFITPGDQSAIALDVTNLSGSPQKVTVKLEALDPLAIVDGTRTVQLKDKQRVTLRFTATTTGSYGLGLMRLTVDGQGGAQPLRIVRESVLQVQPAHAAERQVRRLRLNPGESQSPQASWISSYYPDSTTVSLTVSNRPPFNVNRLVEGLLNYPYGCTEQTISATLPWVLIDEDAAKQFGLKPRTQAEREAKVAGAIGRLSGMRNAVGSYNLWGGSSSSRDVADGLRRGLPAGCPRPWLHDARGLSGPFAPVAAGAGAAERQRVRHLVGQPAQERRLGPHRQQLRRHPARRPSPLRRPGHGRAGPGARQEGAAVHGAPALRQLSRARALAAASAQLAVAFKLMGDEGRMKAALDQAMAREYGIVRRSNSSYYDEWMGDYGSSVRDYALAYALMSQYGLKHDRSEVLLSQLTNRLGNRSYLSPRNRWPAAGGPRDRRRQEHAVGSRADRQRRAQAADRRQGRRHGVAGARRSGLDAADQQRQPVPVRSTTSRAARP